MMRYLTGFGVAALAVSLLSACGDEAPSSQASSAAKSDGRWVATMSECPGADWDDMQNDPKTMRFFANSECGPAGLSYTGEFRCEQGFVEVQCR